MLAMMAGLKAVRPVIWSTWLGGEFKLRDELPLHSSEKVAAWGCNAEITERLRMSTAQQSQVHAVRYLSGLAL